jgi:type IV pilus assembly protein PilM
MIFGSSKQVLGVDIGSHAIKAVSLKKQGKGSIEYTLEKIAMEPIESQVIVEGDIIDSVAVVDALDRLIKTVKARGNEVAISLSGNSVIIKKITLPKMDEAELAESIQWEAEQYIPFEIDDVMYDYQVLKSSEETDETVIVLVAVKKDKVNDYISVISQVGKETSVVDVDVFALQNCFEANYSDLKDQTVGLVNIGASVTSINVVKQGESLFWRDIMVGGNRHTEAIQRRLGLGTEQAEDAKKNMGGSEAPAETIMPILDSASEELVDVIAKSFDFFFGSSPDTRLDLVLASGGSASTPGLVEMLSDKMDTNVEIMNPFREITINSGKFDLDTITDQAGHFAVAVGLALREAGD